MPAAVSSLNGFRILEVNDAFVATCGYAAEEVVGRNPAELRLWRSTAARKQLEEELVKVGSIRNRDIQLQTKEGEIVDCLVSAETVTIQDQLCVLSVLQDLTERKRSEAELVEAIEAVMQDTSWFSRTVVEKLANLRLPHGSNRAGAKLTGLTAREQNILALLCRGLADKEIAERLRVSHHTVRKHLAAIYAKINVHRRGAAIVWARERGFTGGEAGELQEAGRRVAAGKAPGD